MPCVTSCVFASRRATLRRSSMVLLRLAITAVLTCGPLLTTATLLAEDRIEPLPLVARRTVVRAVERMPAVIPPAPVVEQAANATLPTISTETAVTSSIADKPENSPNSLPASTFRFAAAGEIEALPRTGIPNVLTSRQQAQAEARSAVPYTFAPLSATSGDLRPPEGELPTAQLSPVMAQGMRPDDTLPPPCGPLLSTPRARNFCHRPLYYEDRALEVEGYSIGPLQPALSAARFFGSIPLIPYKLGSEPPRRIVCTTPYGQPGPGTPGNLSPEDRRRGLMYQAGAAMGMVYVLP